MQLSIYDNKDEKKKTDIHRCYWNKFLLKEMQSRIYHTYKN